MAMSYPFKGDIYYEVEASYKAGFSGTQLCISDAIQDVRIETGDINTELMSISEPSIASYSKTMVDPTLHIEWVLQPHTGDSLVSNCWDRSTTSCNLDSLAFEVAANKCSTASDKDSFYYLRGCRCKSFNVKASKGTNWILSADFSVASMVINTTKTGTKPAALGTPYATFNVAGDITWAGTTAAYITEGFDFTVDHNLTDYWDVGNTNKKASIPGAISITGSCDISMDDGGKTQIDEIIASTAITSVIFNTGRTAAGGNGKFTLSKGRFDSASLDLNLSGGTLMSSIPFTFKMLTLAVGT